MIEYMEDHQNFDYQPLFMDYCDKRCMIVKLQMTKKL